MMEARSAPFSQTLPSLASRAGIMRRTRLLPDPDGPVIAAQAPAPRLRSNGPANSLRSSFTTSAVCIEFSCLRWPASGRQNCTTGFRRYRISYHIRGRRTRTAACGECHKACRCGERRLEVAPLEALLTVQGHFLERNHERSFELSSHAAQDFKGLCPRHGGLVSAIFDQCRKNIRNGQDPDNVGYICGAESIGISASVEILMMVPDSVQHLGGDAAGPFQRVVPGCRMSFDDSSLAVIKATRLVENSERNFRFSDVVKHCRRIQAFHVGLCQPQIQSASCGSTRYQQAMLIGAFVMAPHGFQPMGKTILSDRIGNSAGGVFCFRGIYLLAARDGGEH